MRIDDVSWIAVQDGHCLEFDWLGCISALAMALRILLHQDDTMVMIWLDLSAPPVLV